MKTLTSSQIDQVRLIMFEASNIIFEVKEKHQQLEIASKGFGDYVTEVDVKIQEFIEEKILSMFPEHQFFGEEGDQTEFDQTKPCWILDPIDGTTNLIRNMKHSCISLGYWNGQELELGMVYNPFLDELFEGRKDEGAYLIENAKRQYAEGTDKIVREKLQCSQTEELSKALLIFGTCPHDRGVIDHRKIFAVMTEAFEQAEDLLRTGSAALDLAYIAAGRADIFFELKLRPWDFAAGILLCREAGAITSTISNTPINVFETGSILCGNPVLHEQFLPIVEPLTL